MGFARHASRRRELHKRSERHLLGVDTRISWERWSHPFISRIFWWSLANDPGFSVFQKMRAHARMKLSWKRR
jgi:hypothetical protein